jgi:dTDP-4-amino-4,6-dideoxygalactose transaminase
MSEPQKRIEFYRHDLGEDELASIRETFSSPFLTLGPRVGVFEQALADELAKPTAGAAADAPALPRPHVVGVSSCTLGMQMVLHALEIGPGDEVITTPMTYISTPNAALYVGATPVFADVDPRTGLLDPVSVAGKITPRTKAILCVHLYGQMADVRALRAIADEHGLALVEDSAHGFESERDGLRPGSLADAAVFSFYATKTITSGDGGAIATQRPELAERLRRLRNHGTSKDAAARYGGSFQHWDMVELGFKGALTDVEAALLLPQFSRAAGRRARREAIAQRYRERLEGVTAARLMDTLPGVVSTHHLVPVLVPAERREAVLQGLSAAQIGCAVNYRAVHTLTYYRERFALPEESLPHAAAIGRSTVSLPVWPDLPLDDVDRVAETLRGLLA